MRHCTPADRGLPWGHQQSPRRDHRWRDSLSRAEQELESGFSRGEGCRKSRGDTTPLHQVAGLNPSANVFF